jgi:multidrug efflux pump subunit AcrB
MPSRVRAVRVTGPPDGGYEPASAGPPETPADVQLVVILLAVAVVAVAIIIGILFSSAWAAIIVAVLGLGALFSTVWFSRRLGSFRAKQKGRQPVTSK